MSGKIRLGPKLTSGTRVCVRQDEDGTDHIVQMSKIRDGMPLPPDAEVVTIAPECRDGWHDITASYKTGPAQVATPAYRDGWDRIFGGKQTIGSA